MFLIIKYYKNKILFINIKIYIMKYFLKKLN